MFFAPALTIIAATGISSAYAAAVPALAQQVASSTADLGITSLSAEDKKALWPLLIGIGTSILPGLFGKGKRGLDVDVMSEDDKKAFLWLLPMLFGKGKRDLEVDTMSEDDKKALWPLLIGIGTSILPGLFGKGKRGLDVDAMSEDDKKAFFWLLPALFGKSKRDLDVDAMSEDDKKAFFWLLPMLFGKGKRDFEVGAMGEDDKKAIVPLLLGIGASILPGLFGGKKRDLESLELMRRSVIDLEGEEKEAFFGKRDLEALYGRDAGLADALLADEF